MDKDQTKLCSGASHRTEAETLTPQKLQQNTSHSPCQRFTRIITHHPLQPATILVFNFPLQLTRRHEAEGSGRWLSYKRAQGAVVSESSFSTVPFWNFFLADVCEHSFTLLALLSFRHDALSSNVLFQTLSQRICKYSGRN